MGAIRKETTTFVNGEASTVKCRDAAKDKEDGWSITTRPYRPEPETDLLQDAGCTNCTCLLAGNRVLMADGSRKPIEQIKAGDWVMTMSGPSAVQMAETTTLGMTRKAIELRGVGDECLLVSDDHPLWVSRPAKGAGRKEWWGVYNLNHLLFEIRNTTGSDFRELPTPLNFDLPEQVAHETGWLHVRPIYHHLDPATKLYHLVVEDGFSYIAEGFPVLSHLLNAQGPTAPWQGLETSANMAQSVAALLGECC